MPKSTKLFLFPDINVWVALTYEGHVHHAAARDWFASLGHSGRLFFSRFTQLGLLRLLTAEVVMGRDEVMTREEAWRAYDRWLEDERVTFLEESPGLDTPFRALTRSRNSAPKDWADSYLAAFAESSQLTLVTFDHAFRSKAKQLILLKG
ncbi:MAG: TA system VapC family ribonuclease toxin [Candidatus Acidiferrales bacterium]